MKIHTRREFLGLYLKANPKTPLEKKQNELNLEIAEKIYLKRMRSLMLEENRLFNRDVLEGDFIAYANNYILGKARAGINVEHYKSVLKYLKKYAGDHFKFRHIDEVMLQKCREFLLTTNNLRSTAKSWI